MSRRNETQQRIEEGIIDLMSEGVWPTATQLLQRIGKGSRRDVTSVLKEFARTHLPSMAAKPSTDSSINNTVSDDESRIAFLEGQLAQSRADLQLAFERFDGMEKWMYGQIDKARSESVQHLDKLKQEHKKERDAWHLDERRYLNQLQQLEEQLILRTNNR